MPKIITDKQKVEKVLNRGVENIYSNREALEKVLLSGKRIKLYCGFDPSAPSLHLGNAILLNKLAQFQELGHEVIFLVGDFTGMIGDPSDKLAARKKMTRQEVLANAKNYKKQAATYLKFSGANPAKIMYNSQWSDKMTFKDLIELTSNFTVQQMIQRDMFEKRFYGEIECPNCRHWISAKNIIDFGGKFDLDKGYSILHEKISCFKCTKKSGQRVAFDTITAKIKPPAPIYLHEFLYPLAQGYDSVAMEVDLEIGGNDQTFNMLVGRDLIKAILGKEKFVLTMKLLADPTGKKMGKTEGNMINLDEPAEEMYGKIMSWPDEVMAIGFELCTKVPIKEVVEIYEKLKDPKTNPRDLKMKLAYEITKINHGEKKAKVAQEYFIKTVQKKEVPEEVKIMKLSAKGGSASGGEARSMNIVDLLIKIELAVSKGEARRLIEQGGIKIKVGAQNFVPVQDINKIIDIPKDGVVIQRGKRQFVKVVLK